MKTKANNTQTNSAKNNQPATKIQKAQPKAEEQMQKENYLLVPPSQIIADEMLNPRLEYGEIEELMNSILENGIKSPLKGYEKEGKIVLKDGHRRMRAINLALERGNKIERVPVIIEKRQLNEEERTLEYLIYNDGKPLTMLEQSEVIRRLINYGWKTTDIVKKTGKARGYIENLIMLTQVPKKVHHQITDGKISANTVILIMQGEKGDAEKTAHAVEAAIKNAEESGKEKATPKHVDTKQVKGKSFGKFYKWAEEIADTITEQNNILSDKRDVLCELLLHFENGVSAQLMVAEYFTDKSKVKSAESEIIEVTDAKDLETK